MHNRLATFITPDITPAQRDEIIAAYLSPDITLTDLAASQNLSLPDLLAFLALPSTLDTLDTLERIAARRDRLLSISARRCALDRLVQLVRVDPTERRLLTPTLEARARETSRRAAATLERLTRPTLERGVHRNPLGHILSAAHQTTHIMNAQYARTKTPAATIIHSGQSGPCGSSLDMLLSIQRPATSGIPACSCTPDARLPLQTPGPVLPRPSAGFPLHSTPAPARTKTEPTACQPRAPPPPSWSSSPR